MYGSLLRPDLALSRPLRRSCYSHFELNLPSLFSNFALLHLFISSQAALLSFACFPPPLKQRTVWLLHITVLAIPAPPSLPTYLTFCCRYRSSRKSLQGLRRRLCSRVPMGEITSARPAWFSALHTLFLFFGGILRHKLQLAGTAHDLSGLRNIEGEVVCREEMLLLVDVCSERELLDDLARVLALWHLKRKSNQDIDKRQLIPVHACLVKPTAFTLYHGADAYRDSTLSFQEFIFALLLEGYVNSLLVNCGQAIKHAEIGADVNTRLYFGGPPRRGLAAALPPTPLSFSSSGKSAGLAIARTTHAHSSNEHMQSSLKSQRNRGLSFYTKGCIEAIAEYRAVLRTDPDPDWKPTLPEASLGTVENGLWIISGRAWTPNSAAGDDVQGNSFTTLVAMAADPNGYREILETRASKLMVCVG
ncbi:hypothetical protein C8J57DRAFT_1492548 [Mycena rebaudengoi]|nr:hypothetical protein C8J57DRAFT_1492548 [Mycena rebaudengoi]